MNTPRVVILGRINVGKSTLFNRLLKRREAIIHPEPGVTRDRKSAPCRIGDTNFILTDTGGLFSGEPDHYAPEILRQAQAAVQEASLILLVVEAGGLTGSDHEYAALVRKSGKPVLVVANKSDRLPDQESLAEMYELGFEDIVAVSAEHGHNINNLRTHLAGLLATLPPAEQAAAVPEGVRFVVIGRPNVGKSSLLNRILNQERTIVSAQAGTTRDTIEEGFFYKGRQMVIADTAGLRRRSRVRENVEFYSTVRARSSIERAEVAVLLLEPDTLLTDQDKKICDIVMQAGRGLIFAINKWDLIEDGSANVLREKKERLRFLFPELAFVPLLTTSAHSGRGIRKLLNLLLRVQENMQRQIETTVLNRFSADVLSRYSPSRRGKQLKLYYAVQTGTAPPHFTFFVNNATIATPQYEKYVINRLRENFEYDGVPIFVHFRNRKR